MSPWRNRLGYSLCIAALAVLLVIYGQPYILCMLGLLVVLGIIQVLGVRRDADILRLELQCGQGCRAGGSLQLSLTAHCAKRLLVAKAAVVELEIRNEMLGTVRTQQVLMPLYEKNEPVQLEIPARVCGAVSVHCSKVEVWDLLEICCADAAASESAYTIIWPRSAEVQLVSSLQAAGSSQMEGVAQSRRGSDLSEIFDFKEYAPGDDVRAIHWKLSGKTDHLMLREGSEPSHYDVALMVDAGLQRRSGSLTAQELNAAASLVLALGEQLLENAMRFCLLFPTRQGLVQREIRTLEALQQALPLWLSEPLPPQAGAGLQLFRAGSMEQQYTRLMIVSAGQYEQDLQSFTGRLSLSVVSAAEQDEPVYTTLSPSCEIAVLPAALPRGLRFRVIF